MKRLKDEIVLRKVLVLNNSSLHRVVFNKILSSNVLVTFSPSNIPCLYLNEFNFGILKFVRKTEVEDVDNQVNSNEKIKATFNKENLIPNLSKLEYFDLKYVSINKLHLLIN